MTELMLWLWFFTLWTAAGAHCLQNAALHKQATQNSLFTDDHPHTANLAVDGNSDPVFTHGSCACTDDTDDVNWWQVDLGDFFSIVQVKVTNRVHSSYRLHDFDVQVSNTSSMSLHDLCAHYAGAMPRGATETIMCGKVIAGRFLRISKISNHTFPSGDQLQLCEVEVHVLDRKNPKFYRNSGKKVVSSRPLLPVAHRVLCGQSCLQDSTCVGFNYQEGTNMCQLLYSTENPISDTQWSMYSLNLIYKLSTTALCPTHSGGCTI